LPPVYPLITGTYSSISPVTALTALENIVFIEVGCILAGIPVGYALRHQEKVVHSVDKLTMWAIYGLLFLLGVSLGSNENLVAQLGTIGVRAMVISLSCLIGSAAATWALERYILRGRLDER
jgi:uncharacterized membrane protein YbjE (DUF340 family)